MRKLLLFIALAAAVLVLGGSFTWWVDPFGEVWKPAAVAEARSRGCLVSQELIGVRYFSFKLDVFHHRPTRVFVAGSSRVLQISARPGEQAFSNLGYPGTSPETLLRLFRALPASPRQTVYLGVEGFWFNRHYAVPDTSPSDYSILRYLVSRSAFWEAVNFARQAPYIRDHRWHETHVGRACTIGRIYPSINWRLDGSRVWSWELDPHAFQRFHAVPFTGDLASWRNGYYDDWRELDRRRLRLLDSVLSLAQARGWRVVGFAPPEPPAALRVLEADPRVAPRWREFEQLMPRLFAQHGFTWVGLENGRRDGCRAGEFPDGFHSDETCSALVRRRLDEAARPLH